MAIMADAQVARYWLDLTCWTDTVAMVDRTACMLSGPRKCTPIYV